MANFPSRTTFVTDASVPLIDTGATPTISVDLPATLVEGNLLLMMVSTGGGAITTPSGWTIAHTDTLVIGSTLARQTTFYKYVEASETDPVSVTVANDGDTAGALIIQVQDVRESDPIETNTASTASSTSTPDAPAVTTDEGNCYAIYYLTVIDDDYTPPSTNLNNVGDFLGNTGLVLANHENTAQHATTYDLHDFGTLDSAGYCIATTLIIRGPEVEATNAIMHGCTF